MIEPTIAIAELFLKTWLDAPQLQDPTILQTIETGHGEIIARRDEFLARIVSNPETFDSKDDLSGVNSELTLLGLLSALDWILGAVHPRRGDPAALSSLPLANQWRSTGVLAQIDNAALLVRWNRETRSPHINDPRDLFHNVIPVPANVWETVTVVPPSQGPILKPVTSVDLLKVACLPFLDSLDDLGLRSLENEGSYFYLTSLNEKKIVSKMMPAIESLASSGASIAVLPELVCNSDLVPYWQSALSESPDKGHLRMILIGTGPADIDDYDRPHNQAVALSPTGEVLARYEKRQPFAFTEDLLSRWRLDPPLSKSNAPFGEWMTRGTTRLVLETEDGRFTIMICEDVARARYYIEEMTALEPTLIFVPIFGGELSAPNRDGWVQRSISNLTTWGATVIAANSLIVPKSLAVAKREGSADPVCALMMPSLKQTGVGELMRKSEAADNRYASDPLVPIVFDVRSLNLSGTDRTIETESADLSTSDIQKASQRTRPA